MSGRRARIKGYLRSGDGRGCGHVFGLLVRGVTPAGPDVVRWPLAPIKLSRLTAHTMPWALRPIRFRELQRRRGL
jgi:hypothetical protein